MVRSMDSITIGMEWYHLVLTWNQHHYGCQDIKTICIDTYAIPMHIGLCWCAVYLWVPNIRYWLYCSVLMVFILSNATSFYMYSWYQCHIDTLPFDGKMVQNSLLVESFISFIVQLAQRETKNPMLKLLIKTIMNWTRKNF